MANTELAYNDHVRYTLQNGTASSLKLIKEPDGWKEDELELTRHEKYHGMFTQFTGQLQFRDEAREYINNAFEVNGLNTNMYLIREIKTQVGIDVKWTLDYIGLADFETWGDKDGAVRLNFNSNDLETIIKSHESDMFELERKDSIDTIPITELTNRNRTVFLEGRTLIDQSYSRLLEVPFTTEWYRFRGTAKTKVVAQGHPRHSSVDIVEVSNDTLSYPNHMFFVDDVAAGETVDMTINWDVEFKAETFLESNTVRLYLEEWTFNGSGYTRTDQQLLVESIFNGVLYKTKGSVVKNDIPNTVGYMLVYDTAGDIYNGTTKLDVKKQDIRLTVSSWAEGSFHRFLFVNDIMSRLMEILTGKTRKFYSKLFGRKLTSLSNKNEYNYEQNGKYGLIAAISGFWARNFDPESEKYKSMQISLQDAIESLQAVFNVGVTVESIGFEQRLRIEDLKYFYQEEVVIKLPFQVNNVDRSGDNDLYFSGTEIGYTKGGDYENEVGLDEPNTKTSTVTPIRKTKNKYTKISKVRSDEYGLERLRRKPQIDFPEEDTGDDEDNWFLDLKESEGSYSQVDWSDRLEQEPTGVLSPETYRSMLFTPLRMLFRHGWIIRAGMEQSINMTKFIKYINTKANKKLRTWFIGEEKEYGEDSDVQVKDLERPRFLPKIIKFTHPVDEALMKQIKGYTQIEVEGSYENVPNVYFKIEFINEKGEKETGYLMNLKPMVTGQFELIKANENLIF